MPGKGQSVITQTLCVVANNDNMSHLLCKKYFVIISICTDFVSQNFDGISMTLIRPSEIQQDDQDVLIQEPAKVILFNDDVHTFDEVIAQLIKALRCSTQKAESLAWEVHNNGKAVVYTGEMQECLRVNSVLEEIALHTQIEI